MLSLVESDSLVLLRKQGKWLLMEPVSLLRIAVGCRKDVELTIRVAGLLEVHRCVLGAEAIPFVR